MKRQSLVLFVIVTCLVTATSIAQENYRTYYPTPRTVTFYSQGGSHSIEIDPEFDEITTRIQRNLNTENFDWSTFFRENIGSKIDFIKKALLEEIVDQIQQNTTNSHELYCATLDFVNHLHRKENQSTSRDRFFYDPYELLLIGPKTNEEVGFLFSALLSALCYPLELLEINNEWNVTVPPDRISGNEAYNLDGRKITVVYTPKDRSSPPDEEFLGYALPIESMCVLRRRYRYPRRFQCNGDRSYGSIKNNPSWSYGIATYQHQNVFGFISLEHQEAYLKQNYQEEPRVLFQLIKNRYGPRILQKWK